MNDVSTLRLYLMRALYLLMFVGQGIIQAPQLVHTTGMAFWHSIGSSMLLAMALLAGLGIRYPLQVVPLLLFELLWKMIWLLAVALPKWSAHTLDPDSLESLPSILMVVIVPVVIPWGYVFANYVRKPADRWRTLDR
jgi:hypothetical protein